MKRFSFSRNTILLIFISLLAIGLFHGIRSIALVYDRAVVPVYLVSIKPNSEKTYDENGFFIGQSVGIFEYEGHRFERDIFMSHRFELMNAKKPVMYMQLLSAADIGIDTPFWGPLTNFLIFVSFVLIYLILYVSPFTPMRKKLLFDENNACQ